jgi:hypothetical protein
MSSTDAEACSKCGRLLTHSQQACVFGGMIVCAECDKVLRNKQAPQPAPSPKPAVLAETVTSTRACEWCAEPIPEKALKCPHCTKWRKDIAEDRKNFFTYLAAGLAWCLFSIFLFIGVWEDSSDPSIMRSSQFAKLGAWHKRIETPRPDYSILGPQVRYEFSLWKFLISFWGWAVIACVIATVWCGVLARRARFSLERKTGSCWRL